MDSGFYAACSALKTQSNALEIAANNIANVNTTGYRAQAPSFDSVLLQAGRVGPWERLLNQQSVLSGSRLDRGQGNLEHTGNSLDFAIEGPGFFALQTKSGTLYTRNGSFRLSAAGQLVSASGDPVLGTSGPMTLPRGDVTISPDGTISVNGAVAGRLQVSEFDDGAELLPVGASAYSAPSGSGKTAVGSSVRQAMLESSNVNPVAAMVALISAERQAEMMERAMSAFHSDFNRIAANELPKT